MQRAWEVMKSISTGSSGLDNAIGVGGLPRGRIIDIFGPELAGKITLALQAIVSVQRQGGVAAFIDTEHAFDVDYARQLGVSLEHLLISQPDTVEQALEIVETLVRSGAVDLVVVGSVAVLAPRDCVHADLHARLMGRALRMLTATANRTGTCVVFLGCEGVEPGKTLLKFYASVRLMVRRMVDTESGETVDPSRARVKVVKNKVGRPFGEAIIDIPR
jgi:recombination protein RecA